MCIRSGTGPTHPREDNQVATSMRRMSTLIDQTKRDANHIIPSNWQSIAEVQLIGATPLGAASHRFISLFKLISQCLNLILPVYIHRTNVYEALCEQLIKARRCHTKFPYDVCSNSVNRQLAAVYPNQQVPLIISRLLTPCHTSLQVQIIYLLAFIAQYYRRMLN